MYKSNGSNHVSNWFAVPATKTEDCGFPQHVFLYDGGGGVISILIYKINIYISIKIGTIHYAKVVTKVRLREGTGECTTQR